MNKELEIKDKLKELVDEMEELWGELEGFEVRLEHPIVDGQRQGFANIKEFSILHLHRTQIDI
jgi:predicted nuclease with TOPRIM domain